MKLRLRSILSRKSAAASTTNTTTEVRTDKRKSCHVELKRMLLKTSNPPRQLLRFTLDDTRYTLHVTRTDLVAEAQIVR